MNDERQFQLFSERPTFSEYERGESIQENFERFHSANPWVLQALVKLAQSYYRRGYSNVGIGHLFEVLRWEFHRSTTANDFKLNNNFRSRYARLIQEKHPELADMFKTRELRAA